MKKIAFALFLAGICAAPSMASAEMKPYVSLSAGLGMPANTDITYEGGEMNDFMEYKTGYAIEGAVGAKMDMFRVEAAVGYQSSDVDKINFDDVTVTSDDIEAAGLELSASITSVMANGYADFEVGSGIMPYVMGGIGYADVTLQASFDGETIVEGSESAFAWQVGTGIGVKASDNITVDLGYRYFATSDIDVEGDSSANVSSSKVLLGMRYSF